MERLTDRNADGNYFYPKCFEKCDGLGASRKCDNCEITTSICEKLGKYEDLEEQGRLIKLPCKVGDTVWDNDFDRPCAYTITAFSFGECEEYICEPITTKEAVFSYANSSGSISGSFAEREIGKSVFLSKAEAKAKMKELRGEDNDRISKN